jgi:inward rectifier potassium channel
MELQAQVMLMTVESVGGTLQRKFALLTLERPSVLFLPLTWTVVHPIDAASPLNGLNASDFERLQVEFLILIKGIDDTFGQTVHQRFSYRYDEIAWGGKFVPAFDIGHDGDLVLQMDRLSSLELTAEASGIQLNT